MSVRQDSCVTENLGPAATANNTRRLTLYQGQRIVRGQQQRASELWCTKDGIDPVFVQQGSTYGDKGRYAGPICGRAAKTAAPSRNRKAIRYVSCYTHISMSWSMS